MGIVRHGAQDEASEIKYENAVSGLSAINVQDAINEINAATPVVLSDLSNVTLTSVQTNDYLKWDGTAWINAVVSGSEVFSNSYTSTDQTIVSAGTVSLTHSLSNTPSLVQLVLKCTTAEYGYSVDDEVIIAVGKTGTNRGVSVVVDSTSIVLRFGSDTNAINIIKKDTGASNAITNSSWKLIVKAWR